MNLREYEQRKFAIAEILRGGETIISAEKRRDWQDRLQELFTRLAEDRFNLVVVGRFSRGKTSLMNAILATDRLPTGIVPLTSVITTVSYGSKEQVVLKYDNRILDKTIPITELSRHITEQGNPGNIQKIRIAEIQLPADILRRGFCFVDTPGLGSVIPENSLTTDSFLPEADAFLLVTGFESPLSDDELRFLKIAHSWGRRIFVVVNKHDTVSSEERKTVLAFIRDQVGMVFNRSVPIFSVSARDGLESKRSQGKAGLAESGIPALEDDLINFLVAEKSGQFLNAMCERASALLQDLPHCPQTIGLIEKTNDLGRNLRSKNKGSRGSNMDQTNPVAAFPKLNQIASCEICAHVAEAAWEFLSKYQHDLIASERERHSFADSGGFCPFHTWEYESMASPYGTCVGFPSVLDKLAAGMRAAIAQELNEAPLIAKLKDLLPTEQTCVLCAVRNRAELEAIGITLTRLTKDAAGSLKSLSALCLTHLAMLSDKTQDAHLLRELIVRQAEILQRMSEDMSRFALKHNGARRYLASDEEATAARRGLLALAGQRKVTFDRNQANNRDCLFEDGTM